MANLNVPVRMVQESLQRQAGAISRATGIGIQDLTRAEIDRVVGGLSWEGYPESSNIEDVRQCSPTDLYINPGSGTPASCDNPRFRN